MPKPYSQLLDTIAKHLQGLGYIVELDMGPGNVLRSLVIVKRPDSNVTRIVDLDLEDTTIVLTTFPYTLATVTKLDINDPTSITALETFLRNHFTPHDRKQAAK